MPAGSNPPRRSKPPSTPSTDTDVNEGRAIGDIGVNEAWSANLKRCFDVFGDYLGRSRDHYDAMQVDARSHASQVVQNAITTADMIAKQAVAHRDIAIDNEWNPVQQGAGDTLTARAVSLDDASLKAIGAALATAVANALNPAKK